MNSLVWLDCSSVFGKQGWTQELLDKDNIYGGEKRILKNGLFIGITAQSPRNV